MKGYKVFNKDWTCIGFQYEVGKTYEMKEYPVCCESGFHFCRKLIDCFHYYEFDSENKVAEIEATGAIDNDGDETKYCTNKIKIVRELTWHEVLDLVNTGKGNTGRENTGYRNTGNWNIGDRNTGNRNTGNRNIGNCNTGGCNTGGWNTGNWNTGDRNTGDWNTGDWNSTDHSTGCFNTETENIRIFNKPSDWAYCDWLKSKARYVMNECPCTKTIWINSGEMIDSEKEENPTWECTGGYLKIIEVTKEDKQKWWDSLKGEERKAVMSLPNFDKEIFKEITGIEV